MTLNPNLSPLFILLAFALYSLVHSILASHTLKDFTTKHFGDSANRIYRFGFNTFAVVSLLPIFALLRLLPDKTWYNIPAPWVYLSGIIQLLALLGLGLSVLQTGALDFLGLRQLFGSKGDAGLYTGGLYRYVRHPLYSFGMLLLWVSPAMNQNLASFYLAISLYFIIGAYYEERKMLSAFGEEYVKYKEATPMFVPFVK